MANVRFTKSLMGFLIEPARVGPRSRRGMLSAIMEPLKIDPVPLGASQIPTHKPSVPSRRCVAVVLICPCASRRDTRHDRDVRPRGPRRAAPRPRHAHRPLAESRRANTRGRVRGGTFFSGRRRCCLVGGAFGAFRNYLECPSQRKIRGAIPRLGKI